MNFAEGAKRIYIALTCLVGIGVAVAMTVDMPSPQKLAYKYEGLLKDRYVQIAKEHGKQVVNRWDIDWGKDDSETFVSSICIAKSMQLQSDEPTVNICNQYKNAIDGLGWAKAKYLAALLGGLLGFFLGAALFWLLLSWIGRGFVADKKNS